MLQALYLYLWFKKPSKQLKCTQKKERCCFHFVLLNFCIYYVRQSRIRSVSSVFLFAGPLHNDKLVTKGTCAHLDPRGRLVIHHDPLCIFWGCSGSRHFRREVVRQVHQCLHTRHCQKAVFSVWSTWAEEGPPPRWWHSEPVETFIQ